MPSLTLPDFDPATSVAIPVAPVCRMQCRYCNRNYDCQRGTVPGVSTELLEPVQAMAYLSAVAEAAPERTSVLLQGPGDPFDNPEKTVSTVMLLKELKPDLTILLVSSGLNLTAELADSLAEQGVTRVDLLVNGVAPEAVTGLVASVRVGKRNMGGSTAAEALITAQETAVKLLVERKIPVVIRTFLAPGVNDAHIADLARTVASWGAAGMIILPLSPQPGSAMAEDAVLPTREELREAMAQASAHLPVLEFDPSVGTDPVSILGQDKAKAALTAARQSLASAVVVTEERPRVAVATSDSMLVNVHLGQAKEFVIYELKEHGVVGITELRPAPPKGGGTERWAELARTLADCAVILAASIGQGPKNGLADKGFTLIETTDPIESVVPPLFGILPKKSRKERGLMA